MNQIEHTVAGYLGVEFQKKLMWQLLTEVEFTAKILPLLSVTYFDNQDFQKLFQIITEYYKDNDEKIPNIPNLSIYTALKQYTKSEIVYEKLKAIVDTLKSWNEHVLERRIVDDGKVVQEQTWFFIKQQEYRKISEVISNNVKTGNIKHRKTIFEIEEQFSKISRIGDNNNYGVKVFDNIDKVLSDTYRETIPTGIKVIDEITGGGLGRGEIGIILAGTGVGKALPNSHKVLTPNGWVLNGSLKVGDLVIGSDGKPQKVLGVFPQGERDIYEVKFSDGSISPCDKEHLWTVSISDGDLETITLNEIINLRNKGIRNFSIPNHKPIEFKETNTILNFYEIGKCCVSECGTIYIPDHIFISSIEQRTKLLQGILDSSLAYVDIDGDIILNVKNSDNHKNIVDLVRSLGGYCRIGYSDGIWSELLISFSRDSSIIPFTDELKLLRFKYRDFDRRISSIEFSHKEEATCIYVENPDHLYVIDDYVLTHNTTILTKIANSGIMDGKNVLQIVFEDSEEQIQRKHFAIWSGIPLSEMNNNKELVKEKIIEKSQKYQMGQLIIVRMPQDETTIIDIKKFIITYQKKFNITFDMLVLDYLDCLEPHKHGQDQHQAELSIIKVFESMANEFNIPCWSAIQANRQGIEQEWVETNQMGGNIKRAQKTHFLMSVAKTPEMKVSGHANIKILKARFAQDGQSYEHCIYNNDSMEIIINDNKPYSNKGLPTAPDVNSLNNMVNNLVNEVKSYDPLALENLKDFESIKNGEINY